jgi:hypothetical protein
VGDATPGDPSGHRGDGRGERWGWSCERWGRAVIPLALAERLGLAPEVLAALRARDERRKALRTLRAAFKAKEAARVAAAYSSMPKLRPDAPGPTRRDAAPPRFPSRRGDSLPPTPAPLTPSGTGSEPLTPRGVGVAVPSRSNSADGGPTQRTRGESGAKRPQFADLTSLFRDPRHARRDLRTMRGIVRIVSPLDPDAVSAALERALDLIPLAPSRDGLRRRLRGLARVLVAMEGAAEQQANLIPCLTYGWRAQNALASGRPF